MISATAVLRDPRGAFALEPVVVDAPGPGQVLVAVRAVGLCNTDLLTRWGAADFAPTIYGHEGAGVVEAVGEGVTAVDVGDHVLASYDSCGSCVPCRQGRPYYCVEFLQRNLSGTGVGELGAVRDSGGARLRSRWFGQSTFASHALVSERCLVRVDPALDLSLLAPLGCGLQTGAGTVLNGLRVRPGSRVVVYGAGSVGIAAVLAARIAGAADVVAVDVLESRLALAAELGAEPVDDPSDVAGADYAVETTGVGSVIAAAVGALAPGGRLALLGAGTGRLDLAPSALAGRSVTFMLEGESVPQVFVPQMIAWWQAGRFPLERLVTRYPLADINRAEADVASGAALKAVLEP